MKSSRKQSLCALAVALALGTAASAQVTELQPSVYTPVAGGSVVDETPSAWFVELSSPPTADGSSLAQVRQEKAQFRSAASKAGLVYQERRSFDVLFNGFSINISPNQLSKLQRIDGVKAIYPVSTVKLPVTTESIDPNLVTALSMTGADVAQSELGLSGAGVKVAVMDTGIDYNHPDLGGGFGPSYRVITGYDFVGDAYDENTNPVTVPDADPMDCNGHGTHVAGIIGAHGVVTGVAPEVKFGAYRVFGCSGSTSDDIMIAAMERALGDGMQVLNMSIGEAFAWPNWPTAAAATRLVNKGMVVVASFGNDGDKGLWAASAPGIGEKVIGVASYDNTFSNLSAFSVSPDNALFGYTSATGAPPAPISGSLPMTRTGTNTSTADGCAALPAGSLTGKAVLIRRGTCSFYSKASNAMHAGAAAVVLYNNVSAALNPTVAGTPPITIPVVALSGTDGNNLSNRIAASSVTLTWTSSTVSIPNSTGGLISSFSSYGSTPDLTLKPDIGAPGGFIRSTFPIAKGSYANLSGTSMSSPHVAGSAALVLQAKPYTPSQAMRGILQNTAVPKNWSLNPATHILDEVHRQGAGMVQVDKAATSTVSVSPSKLSLGESEAGASVQTLTVSNSGSSPVTYTLSSVNAVSNGAAEYVPTFDTSSNATVAFSAPTVTVPAGGSASFTATITPASSPNLGLYGGYLVLTPDDDGQVYRVPFSGFIGDYQQKVVLSSAPKLMGVVNNALALKTSFTMTGGDVAYFQMHLDHPSRMIRMSIADATSGRDWHRAFQFDYVQKNSAATSVFNIGWDGVTVAGNRAYQLPNGSYVATLSVLKALGDASNPAHWETWTSPVFTIARP